MNIYSKMLFVLVLSAMAVGIANAFALDVSDTSGWPTKKTYAAISPAADCTATGNGGNLMNDGICDNWKVNSGSNPGLHINFNDPNTSTTYVYNLSCNPHATYVPNPNDPQNVVDPTGLEVCPSPNTVDAYIELDWMTGQGPLDPTVITDVVSAYFKHGIQLHVQIGENPVIQNGVQQITTASGDMGVHYCKVNTSSLRGQSLSVFPSTNNGLACSVSSTAWVGYGLLKQNFFGTVDERTNPSSTSCPSSAVPLGVSVTNPNSYNCLTAKRQIFHYAEFVNRQQTSAESSGWAEYPGNDFFMSLGSFENNGMGTIDEQEASLMHELGHNFNLHHGGAVASNPDDDSNCKPNYLSIMSYTYEFRKTADVCRPLDYSNIVLGNSIDENNLNEQQNTLPSNPYPSDNPPPPPGTIPNQPTTCGQSVERPIWFSTPSGGVSIGYTGQPNDWNQNQAIDGSIPGQILNNLGLSGCHSSTLVSLSGSNDWNTILTGTYGATNTPNMNFRASSNFGGNIAGVQQNEIGDTNVYDEQGYNVTLPKDPRLKIAPPDITPPVISPSSDVSVGTTDPNGMVVNYQMPTATDNIGVTNGPTCIPASGSLFPIGSTTVSCTASDAAGNVGKSTFAVNVRILDNWLAWALALIMIMIISGIGIWSIIRHHH